MKTSRFKVLLNALMAIKPLSWLGNPVSSSHSRDRTTLRIEPTAYGGTRAMIQQNVTLRRGIASIAVAALTLVGWNALGQEIDETLPFTSANASILWAEKADFEYDDQLTDLNALIREIAGDSVAGTFCYSVGLTRGKSSVGGVLVHGVPDNFDCKTDPKASANNGHSTVQTLSFASMDKHFDFDVSGGSSYVITIAAHDATGSTKGDGRVLQIAVSVTNADERPVISKAPDTAYVNAGDSLSPIVASRVFSDPEGAGVTLGAVYVCAADDPTSLPAADPAPGGSVDGNCYEATDGSVPADKMAVGEFAKATKRGPTLSISAGADKMEAGNYQAHVFIKGKAQPDGTYSTTSGYAKLVIHIKQGANNVPQFAGGATGYSAKVKENQGFVRGQITLSDGTTPAIFGAGDLDSADRIMYMLKNTIEIKALAFAGAIGNRFVPVAGGLVFISPVPADLDNERTDDDRLRVQLRALNHNFPTGPSFLNFESSAGNTGTVVLNASDGWESQDVPISITVEDVNELDGPAKGIPAQRLTLTDKSGMLNLDDYFHDPEGDAITYEAYTDIGTGVAIVEDGNMLKLVAKEDGVTKTASQSYRVTVVATDSNKVPETETTAFDLTIRHSNVKPAFDAGLRALGSSINENSDKGIVLRPLVDFSDSDFSSSTLAEYMAILGPQTTAGSADLLEVVANPIYREDKDTKVWHKCAKVDAASGCSQHNMKVAVIVKGDLNYEVAERHTLDLWINDGWDNSDTGVLYHVNLGDVNDAPTAKDAEIMDQMIVVHGSGSIDVSDYFMDEDGDRLLVTPTSSDKMVAEVTVDGLAHIMLSGKKEGEATVSLSAADADGATATASFKVMVGKNNPPMATREIDDMMIQVGSFADVELDGLFSDPDNGDMITISDPMTSDEDILLVVGTNDGDTATLIGKSAGMATVTITATDKAGNMTDVEVMVTVNDNEAPMLAMAVEDQTLTRLDPAMVDLSETFVDSDGDMLEIMAMSADESIATVEIVDGSLTITGLMVGMSEITLTATDPDGLSAETMFMASVENVAPVVAEAVPDQTTTRVDDLDVDIDGTFADMDGGDVFTYTVAIEDDTIADVVLNGSMINITGKAVGSTIVTLTATDADGTSVSTTFKVTIENIAPVAAGSLSPVALEVGGDSASQSISGLFTDDGDELTYTLALSGTGIANGSLSGMDASFAPVSRGEVTVTITASDPHGGMASVSGTVTVGDGELKSVASKSLAGFGRALISSVSSSVGSRLMNDGRDSDLTLDAWNAGLNDGQTQVGNNMDSGQAWNTIDTATTVADTTSTSSYGAGNQSQSGMNTIQSIVGSQFALNLGTSDSPSQWSVWGNVDRQSYEGTGYDGLASSVYLGVDVAASECWLFGVALASNDGESDYTYGTATQTMDMSLTTVLPYVSYQPSDNTTIWGVAGMGSGELDTTVVGAENDMSDLSANIAMVGLKQHLTSAGRLQIDLRGDVAMANIETDEGSNAADGLLAEVNRLRLGVEGSFTSDTGQGGTVTPFGQVNLRSDGGDGDTGTGVEISGGVRMSSSAFTLEARGRTLVMHSADDYSENGFSLMATLNPSQSATGVSVSLAPRWGADAQGMNVLWSDSSNPLQGYDQLVGIYDQSTMSLETQVGYGMLVANERMLLTPFVDVDVSDASRRQLLLGANLSRVSLSNANLAVQFALGRVEERTGETSGKVGLNASISF